MGKEFDRSFSKEDVLEAKHHDHQGIGNQNTMKTSEHPPGWMAKI